MRKLAAILSVMLFVSSFSFEQIISPGKNDDEAGLRKKLLGSDYDEATEALRFVIGKKDEKLICLGLSNQDWLIREMASKAIADVATKDSILCMADALEKNQDLITGGSEATSAQEELNTDLVHILVRLTHNKVSKKEKYSKAEIADVLAQSRKWCEQNRAKKPRT